MVRIPIKVGKADWEIRSEEKQWVLGRIRVVETGKTKGETQFVPEGFYSSLKGVLDGAFEHKLRNSDAESLTDLLIQHKKANEELKGLYETHVE
jgi:hypothetical protein